MKFLSPCSLDITTNEILGIFLRLKNCIGKIRQIYHKIDSFLGRGGGGGVSGPRYRPVYPLDPTDQVCMS